MKWLFCSPSTAIASWPQRQHRGVPKAALTPWHSFPADEVHFLAEIVPQLRLRRVAQLGQIALEFDLEKVMELVAIHDDPAAVVLQKGADRPYFAIAANL